MCRTLSTLVFVTFLALVITLSTQAFEDPGGVNPTSRTEVGIHTSTQTENNSNKQDIESQKLDLERERFEFEKQRRNDSSGFFQQHLSVVLTGIASLLAAFIAAVVSYTQIKTANIAKANELQINRSRNEAEDERQWRLSLLDFIVKHRNELFSSEPTTRDQIVLLMTVSFPTQYTNPFLTKLNVASPQPSGSSPPDMKKQVLDELLGPLYVEFERTKQAFKRWSSKNLFLEANTIREGNLHIRDTLLQKAHLIPAHLRSDAVRLVEHYDVWLEEFDRLRGGAEPDNSEPFVFAGPKGYPFPRDAERHFLQTYRQYQKELEPEKAASS